MDAITSREQLTNAIIACNLQEEQIEIIQQLQILLPEEWQPLASMWAQIAIQKFQENAILLDELLE